MKGIIGIMQDKLEALIPVDGNRYFTPYGVYTCKVTVSESLANTVKIKVLLLSEGPTSEIARVYKISGTRQAIKKKRLNLVMDIHQWALLDRHIDTYWVNKMMI